MITDTGRSKFWGLRGALIDVTVVTISLFLAAFLSISCAFVFLLISFIAIRLGDFVNHKKAARTTDEVDSEKARAEGIKNNNKQRNYSDESSAVNNREVLLRRSSAASTDCSAKATTVQEPIAKKQQSSAPPKKPDSALLPAKKNTRSTLDCVLRDIPAEAKKLFSDIGASHTFNVRGKNYLQDHKKILAKEPLCRFLMMDVYSLSTCGKGRGGLSRQDHIVRVGQCKKRFESFASCKDCPFQLVLNIQLPGDPPISLVCFFSVPPELFQKLVAASRDVNTSSTNTSTTGSESAAAAAAAAAAEALLRPSEKLFKRFIDLPISSNKNDGSISVVAQQLASSFPRSDSPCTNSNEGAAVINNSLSKGSDVLPLEDNSAKSSSVAPATTAAEEKDPSFKSSGKATTSTPNSGSSFFSRFGSTGKRSSMSSHSLRRIPTNDSEIKVATSDRNSAGLTDLDIDDLRPTRSKSQLSAGASTLTPLSKDGSMHTQAQTHRGRWGKTKHQHNQHPIAVTGTTSSSPTSLLTEALDLSVPQQLIGKRVGVRKTRTSRLLSMLYSPFNHGKSRELVPPTTVGDSSFSSAYPSPTRLGGLAPAFDDTLPPEVLLESLCSPYDLGGEILSISSPLTPRHKLTSHLLPGEGGELPKDDFRNSRMKLIPCVVEGPWVVCMSIRSMPVLVGQKLTQRYFRGENYMEIDLDIGSDAIASRIVSVSRNYAKNLDIHLGLVIQGEDESELPEELMACLSMKHVDLEQCIPLGEEDVNDKRSWSSSEAHTDSDLQGSEKGSDCHTV